MSQPPKNPGSPRSPQINALVIGPAAANGAIVMGPAAANGYASGAAEAAPAPESTWVTPFSELRIWVTQNKKHTSSQILYLIDYVVPGLHFW